MAAGVVKMRRGETAKHMRNVNMHGDLYVAFQHFVDMLSAKASFPRPQHSTGFSVQLTQAM